MRISESLRKSVVPHLTPVEFFPLLVETKILEAAKEVSRVYRESLAEQKRLADVSHEKKQQMSSSHVRAKDLFKDRRIDWSRLAGDVISAGRPLNFPV